MIAGDTFGDYTVVRKLGRGGMGEVWLLEGKSGRQVAAKILEATADHEARKRFLREAQLALGVKHPNLVETYDVGEDPETGLCYILMEYVPGGTLADYIKVHGPLAIVDAVAVVRAISDVLELGRQKGIVHRDIKPANIMFDAEGTPKLADLGIARAENAGTETTTVTQTGAIIGTPAYMSPEQMLNSHNVDTRADIYSLGVVFFEMLTGQRPNKDDTIVQLMAKAVKGEPLPDVRTLRPEVSASLAQLLNMMVAPNKDGRISTPGQITNALAIIERGGELGDVVTHPGDAVSHRVSKRTVNSSRTRRDSASPMQSPSAPDSPFRSFPKWLIPVLVLAALAGAFFFLAPKKERAKTPAAKVVTRETVWTNVVKHVVARTNTIERVVKTEVAVSSAKPVKLPDGTYKEERPEGEWSYVVRDGRLWLGDGEHPALYPQPEGKLCLPSSFHGMPVKGISRWAFRWCREVKDVEIPEGYETVGDGAFFECDSMSRVSLPQSLRAVRNCAFCRTKVCSLNLGRIAEWDFSCLRGMNCLEDIAFDSRNRQFVKQDGMVLDKSLKRLLFVPRGRTSVYIPESVTRIEGSACDTCHIRSLIVPKDVRHIGHMAFSYCGELRRVALPDGDIHFDGQVFQWCTNLVEMKFGEGIKHLDEWAVFTHCSSLRKLKLPDSLETMGAGTFEHNTSLEEIHFGRSLRRIGYRSFGGDISLNSVRLPLSLCEMVAECFKDCNSLRVVRFDGDAPMLIDEGNQRGVDIFMGTPRDLVVYVKRGSKGWNPNGEGLPDRWPVGAGGNARKIRYVDERDTAGLKDSPPSQDKRKFNPEKLKDGNPTRAVQKTLDALFPGWRTSEVGNSGRLGYWEERDGERDVLCTHPLRRGVPLTLSKTVAVSGREPMLHVKIANNERGRSFRLRVRINGQNVREKEIMDGWTDVYVALSKWRNKKAKVELDHMPTGWCAEWAFWSAIEIVDDPNLVEVERVQSAEPVVKLFDHEKIEGSNPKRAVQRTCDVLFPRWKVSENGHLDEAGYEEEYLGRYNLLLTHPPAEGVPVVLSRNMRLPRGNPKLHVSISNQLDGDFELQVRVNGKIIARHDIMGEGWKDLTFDLSAWAECPVKLELLQMPTGWHQEWAHWQRIEVK